jgi:hypothetical protein
MERAAANPGPAEQGALIGGVAGGVGGSCCGLIYPLVLLYFMFRPEVVAALCHGQLDGGGRGPAQETGNPYQAP